MERYEARTVFLMFDRGVEAILPRGTKQCRKGMKRMDAAFGASSLRDTVVPLRALDDEARVMLRARCGLCPKRCKEPLA